MPSTYAIKLGRGIMEMEMLKMRFVRGPHLTEAETPRKSATVYFQ